MHEVHTDRYGLVTLAAVRAAGRSRSWWHRAHHAGLLVAVHPGVSRLAHARPSPQQALRAATTATGGMASHLSAAWLWGAPVTPVDPIDVTVLDRHRSARLAGVRVHRPTDRIDLIPVERRGVPVTGPMRTLVDVGAVASRDVVAAVLATFLADELVTDDAVRDGLEHHSRRGRSGVGALRAALGAYRVPLTRGA